MSQEEEPTEEFESGEQTLMKLFDESNVGFFTRLKRMFAGLSKPADSREYKEARIELQRLMAPLMAVVIPLVFIGLIAVMATAKQDTEVVIESQVLEAEKPPELEEIEKPEEPPPPEDTQVEVDIDSPPNPIASDAASTEVGATDQPMSPQPNDFDAVAQVKSPVVFKNVFGAQRTGTKGALLARGGGDAKTEAAVMAALRWLKYNQQSNGAFKSASNPQAMTALGLLCFLAHGERPGDPRCKEFGETVQRAIVYLCEHIPSPGQANAYPLAIVAYALSEAYGMTMNPEVGEAAARALAPIVKGQHPTGGWDYGMRQTDRNDVSLMGWCCQALKAGHLAKVSCEGLEEAYKKSLQGMKKNVDKEGYFCYTWNSQTGGFERGKKGLTAVGTLCMQLLGASNDPDCKKGLEIINDFAPGFPAAVVQGVDQYHSYYATQVRFFQGGAQWKKWNAAMKPLYLGAMQRISDTYEYDGKYHDMGFWENKDPHTVRPIMDTCLCALQLMVYYRNLPTTKSDAVKVTEVDAELSATDSGDVKVDTGDL
ncbi:MAG: prenyltransferase/squalene oxidase repeat-containing protein [Kiritimatiellia bacterium]|nr:prenyltransferase/squalene oxidase repeat-containing protein [Kiritimatiellia bacterium]